MNENKIFVKTSDEETAELLRKAGLVEMEKQGNIYVFINDSTKANFAENNNVIYDNKLSF